MKKWEFLKNFKPKKLLSVLFTYLHNFFVYLQSQYLEFQWRKQLKELLQDIPENDKPLYKNVLTLEYQYCISKWKLEPLSNINQFKLLKILPKITKIVLDNVNMRHIIGTQPMNGPVGLGYLLRYGKTNEDGNITLKIVSSAIEAVSRQCEAGWCVETAEDLKIHGIDIEKEIIEAVGIELAHEIDVELLNLVNNLAHEEKSVDINFLDSDDLFKIIVLINLACNEIAIKTRRGPANKIIVSPIVLALLQTLAKQNKIVFAPMIDNTQSIIKRVGILNETIEVYCNILKNDDSILVAYKGGNGETDVGLAWMPYLMIVSAGLITNPHTLKPSFKFVTRRAILVDKKSNDYYAKIPVNIKTLTTENKSDNIPEID